MGTSRGWEPSEEMGESFLIFLLILFLIFVLFTAGKITEIMYYSALIFLLIIGEILYMYNVSGCDLTYGRLGFRILGFLLVAAFYLYVVFYVSEVFQEGKQPVSSAQWVF